jgi:hypothetical protein
VVATANDPTCLDPAILKRPGRFDRVVQFRNPDADLRREYYQRLSPTLRGEQFEVAIENTEGFSFAQLRETYILGAQSAFEHGREVMVADVIEAIALQAAGSLRLKSIGRCLGFCARSRAFCQPEVAAYQHTNHTGGIKHGMINNQGERIGLLTHSVSNNRSITINRTGDVTTVTTLDRNTGSATSETFFGDSPYGK